MKLGTWVRVNLRLWARLIVRRRVRLNVWKMVSLGRLVGRLIMLGRVLWVVAGWEITPLLRVGWRMRVGRWSPRMVGVSLRLLCWIFRGHRIVEVRLREIGIVGRLLRRITLVRRRREAL